MGLYCDLVESAGDQILNRVLPCLRIADIDPSVQIGGLSGLATPDVRYSVVVEDRVTHDRPGSAEARRRS